MRPSRMMWPQTPPPSVCAYHPSSKTAVAIYFLQLVIYFLQLATNCHPLCLCIQKHHSQRTFMYCCEKERNILHFLQDLAILCLESFPGCVCEQSFTLFIQKAPSQLDVREQSWHDDRYAVVNFFVILYQLDLIQYHNVINITCWQHKRRQMCYRKAFRKNNGSFRLSDRWNT